MIEKAFCKIHNLEFECKKKLDSLGIDVNVKCPKCIEDERLLEEQKREAKKYKEYIENVKWRMEVSGLPKVIINKKNDISFIDSRLRGIIINKNFFIYGDSGVGKTMSLKYILCKNYKMNIVYIDCIVLKNYSYSKIQKFYDWIDNIDCIMVDELQDISLEVFENIVEIVYNNDGFFVLCGNFSNEALKDFLDNLPYRVKSRLLDKGLEKIEIVKEDKRIK